ncbi:hypothetical protein XFF7767_680006 [Xanthomonas citri pv. fuscans]|nr:hypothetical protein XFF7767_680006 [Xanthomonas citri pv. fuscans]
MADQDGLFRVSIASLSGNCGFAYLPTNVLPTPWHVDSHPANYALGLLARRDFQAFASLLMD